MENSGPRFRRVLLKLSGEALMGQRSHGIDPSVLATIAGEIKEIHEMDVQTAIVIGGGNIFRGLNSSEYGMGRAPADYMGMLATVMNCLALSEALNNIGSKSRVMTAIDMNKVAEPFVRTKAINHLEMGRIVLFGAGTGNPFFSTDTAAALRAMETGAEVLLKATKVDGVYDKDPVLYPTAKLFKKLTYNEFIEKGLKVMDMTAVTLAMGNNLPVMVFNMKTAGNIKRIITGQDIGTLITEE